MRQVRRLRDPPKSNLAYSFSDPARFIRGIAAAGEALTPTLSLRRDEAPPFRAA